jgi:hypothetical protein
MLPSSLSILCTEFREGETRCAAWILADGENAAVTVCRWKVGTTVLPRGPV